MANELDPTTLSDQHDTKPEAGNAPVAHVNGEGAANATTTSAPKDPTLSMDTSKRPPRPSGMASSGDTSSQTQALHDARHAADDSRLSDEEQAVRSLDIEDTMRMRPVAIQEPVADAQEAMPAKSRTHRGGFHIPTAALVAGVALVSFVCGGTFARMSSQVPVMFGQGTESARITESTATLSGRTTVTTDRNDNATDQDEGSTEAPLYERTEHTTKDNGSTDSSKTTSKTKGEDNAGNSGTSGKPKDSDTDTNATKQRPNSTTRTQDTNSNGTKDPDATGNDNGTPNDLYGTGQQDGHNDLPYYYDHGFGGSNGYGYGDDYGYGYGYDTDYGYGYGYGYDNDSNSLVFELDGQTYTIPMGELMGYDSPEGYGDSLDSWSVPYGEGDIGSLYDFFFTQDYGTDHSGPEGSGSSHLV